MFKHYIVIRDWATGCDKGTDIVAVTHTKRKAKKKLAEVVNTEKLISNPNWETFMDTCMRFDVGERGDYNNEHTFVYIEKV